MLQKIFRLLKNIQFWTILGTIATIVSCVFVFYHPKQSEVEIFIGADSRLVGPISSKLDYDFYKSDTIAIFYLMPILEEDNHSCYYIVDLPFCLQSNSNQTVRNVLVTTKYPVPDYSPLHDPMVNNYSGALDVFFDNSNKYPRLFVNNSEDLIREYDNSTSFVDFSEHIPSHTHIKIPLRLIFYTPTNIRNQIVDSFSFDLVIGEEDYENKIIPIKVYGFLCNINDYNSNHNIDQEDFHKVASQYNTVIYVNALLEECKDTNKCYWVVQKGVHLVSYINSSIGTFHVFNSEKLNSRK